MKPFQMLKNIYIIVFKSLLRLVYNISVFLRKQDESKIIIALYRSNELEGNLKYVHDELKKQIPECKIHLISSENKMNLKLFKEVIILSNARYLIIDDYFLPIYLILPTPDLKVIQLWHAAGALKKFGYSTVGTRFGPTDSYLGLVPIHSNYTHVYVSSSKVIKFYAEAFNMSPSRIFPLGIPRIDLFNNKDECDLIKREIFFNYPMLQQEGMVKILMAPTYRADGKYGESDMDMIGLIIQMSYILEDNKQIIFKVHPYTNEQEVNRLIECPNIIVADKYSINEWMLVSDAFITDYSSAIFEYSLLKKPMAHFVPDISKYKKGRGFYEEIECISDGTILTNELELIDWINVRKIGEAFDSSKMVDYNFDHINNVTTEIVKHFIHD